MNEMVNGEKTQIQEGEKNLVVRAKGVALPTGPEIFSTRGKARGTKSDSPSLGKRRMGAGESQVTMARSQQ